MPIMSVLCGARPHKTYPESTPLRNVPLSHDNLSKHYGNNIVQNLIITLGLSCEIGTSRFI